MKDVINNCCQLVHYSLGGEVVVGRTVDVGDIKEEVEGISEVNDGDCAGATCISNKRTP